jgi:hypothetical protein
MAQNTSTISNLRPSKIYPNWDFWFDNKPSGSPARYVYFRHPLPGVDVIITIFCDFHLFSAKN